ncbi:MAG: SH3 domain-containing protein [Deltaproteobacteria bacterium]|nr:SH3 domain-containing protein [Deltaproteobacteria bacterium]
MFRAAGLLLFSLLWLAPQAMAATVCVSQPLATLMEGPGPGFPAAWTVVGNTPLEVVLEEGEWLKVKDMDGEIRWIYRKMVSDKVSCAQAKINYVPLWPQPDASKDKTASAQVRTAFLVTAKQGDWVKLDYEGMTVWTKKNYLWGLSDK